MDSILKTVLDNDLAALQNHIETKIDEKIADRVADKKIDVLAKMNGLSREKMEEIVNIEKDTKKE